MYYDPYVDYVDYDSRIIGGSIVEKRVPWFAWLKIDTKNGTKTGRRCGATLIDSSHLISAAHCFCQNVQITNDTGT